MNRPVSWLKGHAAHILTLLFVIQPVLDVFSFWLNENGITNLVSLALRLLILGICVVTAFLISDRKWVYWTMLGILALLFAGHLAAAYQYGSYNPINDFTNYIRVILMPVTTICIITYLQQNEKAFDGMQLGLTLALYVMFAVEILATAMGTTHHTYADGMGIIGWFSNTNSQSSNLSCLLALALGWQLSNRTRSKLAFGAMLLTAALGFAALYFFCTRLAYLGLAAVFFGFFLSLLLVSLKNWKISLLFLAFGILAVVLLPGSPMMRRINSDSAWQDQRQGWISQDLGGEEQMNELKEIAEREQGAKPTEATTAATDDPTAQTQEPTTPPTAPPVSDAEHKRLVKALTPIYERHLPDFIEIFGLEETMEMFHYSMDVRDFSAIRAKKLMFAHALMVNSPFTATLFGVDLNRFTVNKTIYDVENDFHGIYYLQGAVGFAFLLAFLAYFIFLIIWALCKNARRYFTIEAAGYGIALLMCLVHCYNTAGVLRRPNASVYLSAILAGIYYLVRLRKYEDVPSKKKAR